MDVKFQYRKGGNDCEYKATVPVLPRQGEFVNIEPLLDVEYYPREVKEIRYLVKSNKFKIIIVLD